MGLVNFVEMGVGSTLSVELLLVVLVTPDADVQIAVPLASGTTSIRQEHSGEEHDCGSLVVEESEVISHYGSFQ
jgi:hypothetical protein